MTKTVGILGLGLFGTTIAKQLCEYDCDIIAVDSQEENVNRLEPFVTKGVIADVTNMDVLEEIGIGDCDVVVVATGSSLEASILSVIHCPNLDKVGVKLAVTPTVQTAEMLSNKLYSNDTCGSVTLNKKILVKIKTVKIIKIISDFLAIS